MDEPYYFGHFYDGPGACHWTDMRIAEEVGNTSGHEEVFHRSLLAIQNRSQRSGRLEYVAWLVAFRAVNGYDLAFLHMDIDWTGPAGRRSPRAAHVRHPTRIPVGIIYTGNHQDSSDEAWISIAGSGSNG